MKVAAVTMVYNEAHFLPRWIRHYVREFGAENCTIVDHGSDDGCADGLSGINLVRIPRSPADEVQRAQFLSSFCAALLTWYDWVVYTDVDEFLVADPNYYPSIRDLLAASPHPVINAIGFNVLHEQGKEPPIDPNRPVSEQRRWIMLVSSMCKPLAISRPVQWAPGYHSSDAPVEFDRLFLFHLRFHDFQYALARLQKTRTMQCCRPEEDPTWKLSDEVLVNELTKFMQCIRRTGMSLDLSTPPIANLLEFMRKQATERKDELYKIRLDLAVPELWELPRRFVGTF